jgi:Flp pilus assembly protein TadG
MTKRKPATRRGQAMLEFTFVGIPIMFILISVFEISRGMWIYHTLANSVKAGVRYAIVHGRDCDENDNFCPTTVAQVAQVIQDAGVGLDVSTTSVTFSLGSGTTKTVVATCNLGVGGVGGCVGNNTRFPTAARREPITIDIVTPFRSAIGMFWPGAQTVRFGAFNLPASSSDNVQF